MKLTIQLRQKIEAEILKHRFDKPTAELLKIEHQLALDVYEHVYDAATLKKMAALPDGFFLKTDILRCSFGGMRQFLMLKSAMPVSYNTDSYNFVALAGDHELSERASKFFAQKSAIDSERKSAAIDIRGVLSKATTIGALIKMWPEAKSIIEKVVAAVPKPTPVAIRMPELNARLGLPPKGAVK